MRIKLTLAAVAAAAAFATASQAWPTDVDIPGVAANGACPVTLVMVNAQEMLMSREVRALSGGACRFSGFQRVDHAGLGLAIKALPKRPVYVQATSSLPYGSLIRVLNKIQDGGNYGVILSNIPLENS